MNTYVFNGWAANARAWERCHFPYTRLFSYVEQLDGVPESVLAADSTKPWVLVGWSMGGSTALRMAIRFPECVAHLVLIAATPCMMAIPAEGWRGMTPRRLEALKYGLLSTRGQGLFGLPPDWPNPYEVDDSANLARGIQYLLETDIRKDIQVAFASRPASFSVSIFQSERDGVVNPANASWFKEVFPHATLTFVPGTEHALPLAIPDCIDATLVATMREV